jgi:hypothetical protein
MRERVYCTNGTHFTISQGWPLYNQDLAQPRRMPLGPTTLNRRRHMLRSRPTVRTPNHHTLTRAKRWTFARGAHMWISLGDQRWDHGRKTEAPLWWFRLSSRGRHRRLAAFVMTWVVQIVETFDNSYLLRYYKYNLKVHIVHHAFIWMQE